MMLVWIAIYCLGRLVPCGRLYGQNLFLAGPRQGRPLTIIATQRASKHACLIVKRRDY